MNIKKILTLAVSVVLTAGALILPARPVKAAVVFEDTAGHWAEEYIIRWAEYGVISGYEGYFRPEDNITRAEFAAFLDKAMKYPEAADYDESVYSDMSPADWYFDPLLRLCNAGVITPDKNGRLRPEDNLTRAEEAVMLAKAFHLTPITGKVSFTDSSNISLADRPYVKAMQENGYITGYSAMGGFEFRPSREVTRAEAVVMLGGMVDVYVSDVREFSENVTGNVLVTAGVKLHDMTVDGNLFVTAGTYGSIFGTVLLDDVTVKKETVLLGDCLVVIFNSRLNRLVVHGSGAASVETGGVTTIEAVEMQAGGDMFAKQSQYGYIRNVIVPVDFPEDQTVTLTGNFVLLSNSADKSAVNVKNAVFNENMPPVPEESSISAERPMSSKLDVTVVSKSLGTLYLLILKGAAAVEPTNAEIMDSVNYSKPRDIFDYRTFRVYPNSSATYPFTGANQTLDMAKQGHVVYGLIVDDKGGITRLESSPVYFNPDIDYAWAQSSTEIIVSLSNYYDSGTDVEQCFNVSVNSKGVEKEVAFRAYSLSPQSSGASKDFKLTLLYDKELINNDVVTVSAVNNPNDLAVCVYKPGGVRLADVTASPQVSGLDMDITGGVSRRSDICCVVTDRYIPEYYNMADKIVRQTLDVTEINASYGSISNELGEFAFTVEGIGWPTDIYYVYLVATNKDLGYSEVTMLVVERKYVN